LQENALRGFLCIRCQVRASALRRSMAMRSLLGRRFRFCRLGLRIDRRDLCRGVAKVAGAIIVVSTAVEGLLLFRRFCSLVLVDSPPCSRAYSLESPLDSRVNPDGCCPGFFWCCAMLRLALEHKKDQAGSEMPPKSRIGARLWWESVRDRKICDQANAFSQASGNSAALQRQFALDGGSSRRFDRSWRLKNQ
jgi:hypothetical protein